MVRLLLKRLALGLPTALQISPTCGLLFHEGGVKIFAQLGTQDYNYTELGCNAALLARVWLLVDSNNEFRAPAKIFIDGGFRRGLLIPRTEVGPRERASTSST